MVTWDDPRVIVAIYAAIVGSLSLGWNIINHIVNKSRKLKVIYKHQQVFNHIMGVGFSPFTAILSIEATNFGNEGLHIKDIIIKLYNKKIKLMGIKTSELACCDPAGRIKYPYFLSKGEVFKDIISVRDILKNIDDKLLPDDKMYFVIQDTLGKKYKSSKFRYRILFEELAKEKEANELLNNGRSLPHAPASLRRSSVTSISGGQSLRNTHQDIK